MEIMGRLCSRCEDVFRTLLTPVCIAAAERRAIEMPAPSGPPRNATRGRAATRASLPNAHD
jgi:hypothetical protein